MITGLITARDAIYNAILAYQTTSSPAFKASPEYLEALNAYFDSLFEIQAKIREALAEQAEQPHRRLMAELTAILDKVEES